MIQEQRDQLLSAAAAGVTDRDAAIIIGIDPDRLAEFLRESGIEDEYDKAKATARLRSISIIGKSNDWKAHAWLLEHTDPAHWSDKTELAVAAQDDVDEEFAALQARLSTPILDLSDD